jgi:hypothetical protein
MINIYDDDKLWVDVSAAINLLATFANKNNVDGHSHIIVSKIRPYGVGVSIISTTHPHSDTHAVLSTVFH